MASNFDFLNENWPFLLEDKLEKEIQGDLKELRNML
jgi:hypothetical protein